MSIFACDYHTFTYFSYISMGLHWYKAYAVPEKLSVMDKKYWYDIYSNVYMLVFQFGIATSYAVWAVSSNFSIFVIARIIGGISKGNVSLSTAVVADISPPSKRGKCMVSKLQLWTMSLYVTDRRSNSCYGKNNLPVRFCFFLFRSHKQIHLPKFIYIKSKIAPTTFSKLSCFHFKKSVLYRCW